MQKIYLQRLIHGNHFVIVIGIEKNVVHVGLSGSSCYYRRSAMQMHGIIAAKTNKKTCSCVLNVFTQVHLLVKTIVRCSLIYGQSHPVEAGHLQILQANVTFHIIITETGHDLLQNYVVGVRGYVSREIIARNCYFLIGGRLPPFNVQSWQVCIVHK